MCLEKVCHPLARAWDLVLVRIHENVIPLTKLFMPSAFGSAQLSLDHCLLDARRDGSARGQASRYEYIQALEAAPHMTWRRPYLPSACIISHLDGTV